MSGWGASSTLLQVGASYMLLDAKDAGMLDILQVSEILRPQSVANNTLVKSQSERPRNSSPQSFGSWTGTCSEAFDRRELGKKAIDGAGSFQKTLTGTEKNSYVCRISEPRNRLPTLYGLILILGQLHQALNRLEDKGGMSRSMAGLNSNVDDTDAMLGFINGTLRKLKDTRRPGWAWGYLLH